MSWQWVCTRTETGASRPTAILPYPDLSASLPTLQTLILNFMIAKGQNTENYWGNSLLYCSLKVNIKPEGKRIFEGPSCCWMTWTEGFGLDSYGSGWRQISSWCEGGITCYVPVCGREKLASEKVLHHKGVIQFSDNKLIGTPYLPAHRISTNPTWWRIAFRRSAASITASLWQNLPKEKAAKNVRQTFLADNADDSEDGVTDRQRSSCCWVTDGSFCSLNHV